MKLEEEMTEAKQLGFDIDSPVTEVKIEPEVVPLSAKPEPPEESITVTDQQGIDHTIFASSPDYTRLKIAYDTGGRVFDIQDIDPDKVIEEAGSILEEAGMICDVAEESNDSIMLKLFKNIMDDRYREIVDSLVKNRIDTVIELYEKLLTEVERLENLEEYDKRYFRLLYQAAVVDAALKA